MPAKFPRSSVLLCAALLASFLLTSCGGGSSNSGGGTAVAPPPTPPTVTKIVAIGDSIGNGFGIATPWPTRLANLLGFQVVNQSVTNEQTSFGLSIIQDQITTEQPTHVVIMLGTNDALRGSASAAINNLQQMVDIAGQNNVIAIVATLPPITRDSTENARAAQISTGIRGLSGARIADVRAVMNNSDIADGVHPDDGGQQKIAETMAAQF